MNDAHVSQTNIKLGSKVPSIHRHFLPVFHFPLDVFHSVKYIVHANHYHGKLWRASWRKFTILYSIQKLPGLIT